MRMARNPRQVAATGHARRAGHRSRRRTCDAHNGVAPAVATITLSGDGATWKISVCAQHLALLEAELGGWGSD